MRVAGAILMLIGLLAGGAAGILQAGYVQPGDWVVGRSQVVNPNHERVVVSSYGSTSYDSGLRITTTGADGQAVFIGTANPIDVDDYTADVARVEITKLALFQRVETSGLAGSKDLPAEPVGLDFWIDHKYGQGAQSLVVDTSGAPAQVMVVAPAGQPISVRVDHVVAGVRTILLGVIGVGAGLVLIGLTLLVVGIVRRNRRQPPDPASTPTAPMPMTPPPALPTSTLARCVAGLLAVSVVLATTGCTVPRTPKPVDVIPRADVTKVPLPSESISRVTADLETRMGTARTTSSPPGYSTEAWPTVYTGVALVSRTFGTTLAKATGDTTNRDACGLVIADLYGDHQRTYPMTTTALLRWGCRPEVEAYYTVLTRAHSYDHWLIAAEVRAGSESTPPKGSTDVVTADEKTLAETVVSAMDGRTTTGLSSTVANVVNAISAAMNPLADKADMSMSLAPPDPATYPTALIASKTQSGMLVTFSLFVTVTMNAKPGYYLYWNPPLDQLLNQPGHRQSLTRRYLSTVAVAFDGDVPTILGQTETPIG